MKENEQKLVEFQMKEIKKRDWKDFNTSKINKLIDEDYSFQVTDINKWKEREIEMKNNILNIIKLNNHKKL